MKATTVRFTEEDLSLLEGEACEENLSLSDVIRRAVRWYKNPPSHVFPQDGIINATILTDIFQRLEVLETANSRLYKEMRDKNLRIYKIEQKLEQLPQGDTKEQP